MTSLPPAPYQLSEGILLCAFGDGAVAVDLIHDRAHFISRFAGWLLAQDGPTSTADVVTRAKDSYPKVTKEQIDEAILILRSKGLIDRDEPYVSREARGDAQPPDIGCYVGNTYCLGSSFVGFRSNDTDLLTSIQELFGPGVVNQAARYFDFIVDQSGEIDAFAADEWHFHSTERLLAMLPIICNDDVARSADVLVLHAGAVHIPNQGTVIIGGPMNAGKSTLVGALLHAGCDYLSDEAIGFDDELHVYGHPKPLTLDATSRSVLQLPNDSFPHVRPEQIRADVRKIAREERPQAILIVRHDPRAKNVSQSLLNPTEALKVLSANTMNLSRIGQRGLSILCDIAEQIPVYSIEHPDVSLAVPAMLAAT